MTCTLSRKKIESFLAYFDEVYTATFVTIYYYANNYGIKANPLAYSIEITKNPKPKENL